MIRVIDASVAVKWLIEEPGSTEARELLQRNEPLIAPDLLVTEVCSAIQKKLQLELIGAEQASEAARVVPTLFDRLSPCAPLAPRALEMAIELGHSAYDCFYLALAELEDAVVVTDDEPFMTKLEGSSFKRRAKRLRASRRRR